MTVHYGGQALIEGVLMRGRSGFFAAVRTPSGEIITREEVLPAQRRGAWASVPVIRGVLALSDTLGVGSRMLLFSADIASGGSGDTMSPMSKRATLGAATAGATLFAVLPNMLASRLRRSKPKEPGPGRGITGTLTEGGIRMGILVGYLAVIGRIPEVRRIFAYHGAEHKTISALEADAALTPGAVQQFDTPHARCGTAFLLQSMMTSTAVYAFVGGRTPLGRVGTRVALLPLVAGVSYEVLQFNARHLESPIVRLLTVPGLWLQRLTTRQPSDDQVEVAIRALQGAMAMDARAE